MVESHKSHAGWIKIQIEVNAAGLFKTVNQCKDKLRNLKDAYKAACDNNNKQTGADAKFPPFFDTFYEIFGTRDVINMPNVLDSGHSNRKTDIDSKNNNNNQQTTNINESSNNNCEEDEGCDVTNEHSNESDTNPSLNVNDMEE